MKTDDNVIEILCNSALKQMKRSILYMHNFKKKQNINNAIIGISGGADSALCAYILKNAGYNIIALIMPTKDTEKKDTQDAHTVCKWISVKPIIINITDIANELQKKAEIKNLNKLIIGNIYARIRMNILYMYSNSFNGIVCGTGDLSEYLLGYFTKYGDGACDIFPILHMYKTQVRYALKELGLTTIAEKPPTPNLWTGHLAEQELGISYTDADKVIYCLMNNYLLNSLNKNHVKIVVERYIKSLHKRTLFSLITKNKLNALDKRIRNILLGDKNEKDQKCD